jgi:hypothetical protein
MISKNQFEIHDSNFKKFQKNSKLQINQSINQPTNHTFVSCLLQILCYGLYVISQTASASLVQLSVTVIFLGLLLCDKISGLGTIAPLLFATRTLVPSSKIFLPTLVGNPVTGSTKLTLE